METIPKKPWYKKWWGIVLIIIGVLIVIGIFASTLKSESQITQHAILSGKDLKTGEVLVQEINVWQKAGSGGLDNVSIGSVPHGTRVGVIESRKIEGDVTIYHIRSSVGKVSVLPTDFNLRKKAMEEKPQEEWTVPADESFPVEGWVHQDFITNLE